MLKIYSLLKPNSLSKFHLTAFSIKTFSSTVEVTHQISTTEAKVVITIPQCYETISKSIQKSKSNAKIVLLSNPNTPLPEGTIRFCDIAENVKADYSILDKIERTLDDLAVIAFSSGTTGLPKGVELSYNNLFSALESMYHERICFPELAHGKQNSFISIIQQNEDKIGVEANLDECGETIDSFLKIGLSKRRYS